MRRRALLIMRARNKEQEDLDGLVHAIEQPRRRKKRLGGKGVDDCFPTKLDTQDLKRDELYIYLFTSD